MSVLTYYDYTKMHPCDITAVLVYESVINGVINNYPVAEAEMPYYVLTLYRNSNRLFRVYERTPGQNIVNLTGAVGIFTIKQIPNGPVYLQKRTNIAGEGMIGAADQGEMFFYVKSEDTLTMPIGQFVWDVTVILPDGNQYPSTANGVLNLLEPVYQP